MFILSWLSLTQAADALAPNVAKEVGIIWADLGESLQLFVRHLSAGKLTLSFFPKNVTRKYPQHYQEEKLYSNVQDY